jgi:hypothetical protein
LGDLSKVPTSPYYNYSPPFLQHYYKILTLLSFLPSTTKANHSFPPQETCGNKYSAIELKIIRGRRRTPMIRVRLLKKKRKKVKEKVLCLVANGR